MKRSSLETKVVRKIEDIPAKDWNSIFPTRLEGYDFFKTLDESRLGQFSFYYIAVYDAGIIIAAAACFLLDYSLDTTVGGSLRRFSNFIKKFFPGAFSMRTLLCGLPMGQGRIGIAGQAGAEAVIEIYAAMERIAAEEKASIIAFKDFASGDVARLDPLLRLGFSRFESLPSTEMRIDFTDFDSYLKSMSRVSRDGLKRKFKKIDGSVKIALETKNSLSEEELGQVYALYLQTVEKHEMGFERLTPEFFRNASRNMPDRTRFFLWRMDGRLAAFAFCLVSGGDFIDYYLGFDYSIAHRYHLYFVRFRDLMKWCIANKVKRYEMGATNYEPKRRLGFEFVPLFIYAKHRSRLVNPLFRLFCRFLEPKNFDPVIRQAMSKQSDVAEKRKL